MKDWFKQNKIIIFLFFLTLIPRLIFMLVAFFIFGDQNFFNGQDVYLPAGLNFLTKGVYTNSMVEPLTPNSFPAPGYPVILAFSWLIIPKYLFVIFWQNIIYSIFIVYIYKFARLFFNNFISLGAAVFMAFEPFSFFWSNVVMPETSFLFFLILSMYFLALFWKEQKGKSIVYSAIFLGLAALIRQIALFFYPAIVLATVIVLWQKISWSKLIKSLVLFLMILLIVTAPWCIRNKVKFNSYTISNQTHFLYFFSVARDFLVLTSNLSDEQADKYLQNLAVAKAGVKNFDEIFLDDKYIPVLKEITFSIIKAQPLIYLKLHLIKALPVFTDSGWMNILRFWRINLDGAQSMNISNLLAQRDWQALSSSLKDNHIFLIRILGIGFWFLINIVALIGVILMLLRKDLFRIGLAMLMIIGYFVFASSWAAMARLRLPFQPFLFIFFVYAIYVFYIKYIKKSYENKYCYTN